MADKTITTCALVVGAGPVGVTLQLLLGRLGIPSILCERNLKPRNHPRAHYVSNRSMEVWRQLGNIDMALESIVEPLDNWRYFKYCRHVMDPEWNAYGVKDHFKEHYKYGGTYFDEHSPSRITNLPQHKLLFLLKAISLRRSQVYDRLPMGCFESWLKEEYMDAFSNGVFDQTQIDKLHSLEFSLNLQCVGQRNVNRRSTKPLIGLPFVDGGLEFLQFLNQDMSNGVISKVRNLRTKTTVHIKSAFVIGTDGIHSRIRRHLDGNMSHETNTRDSPDLNHVISVHFQSNELGGLVSKNPAMMYFIFSKCISVLVCQGGKPSEFVAQIPYFPNLGEWESWDSNTCEKYITEFVGKPLDDIRILNVKKWKVMTDVAESFVDKKSCRIMIAGDAAHVVAPAGGLGMNMGISDTYNIAWRIARIIYTRLLSKELEMKSILEFGNERKSVALYTRDVCLKEIINGSKIAKRLWYNHDVLQNVGDIFPFLSNFSGVSNSIMNIKFAFNSFDQNDGCLGLLFPGSDIAYAYDGLFNHRQFVIDVVNASDHANSHLHISKSHKEYAPKSINGRRIPHCFLYLPCNNQVFKVSTVDIPSLVQPSIYYCFLVFSQEL
ncbi:bifunctional FAD-binding domain/FAD-NAD(P)-binding domain superfamily [Babesia duncani]|uniref:Bifunctional FAD-binding domain/FAD-NAD(P)-binding domain superfamily n=1 Tax=Babesia duncani TaxID=323732 RepID=A0AAD9PMZ6_9APIC|nr:bifunctional FAD-binding domain/FAD-NAD(P)-binding domain superfamily [Babesia duncani]